MIEKSYSFSVTDQKTIERVISDDNIDLNHMILPKGENVPEHYTNSNVYLVITRGKMHLTLEGQPAAEYSQGTIVNIPYKTKMFIQNLEEPVLEFFVVKAPSPKKMA